MKTSVKGALVALVTAACLAIAPAAMAQSDEELPFKTLESQVKIEAIAIDDSPVYENGWSGHIGNLTTGEKLEVSPLQAKEFTPWRAVRTESGLEGTVGDLSVAVIPKGAKKLDAQMEVLEDKAVISFNERDRIFQAPATSAEALAEAVPGSIVEASSVLVDGESDKWRFVETEHGQQGWILNALVKPYDGSAPPSGSLEDESVSYKFTEDVTVAIGAALQQEPAAGSSSESNNMAISLRASEAFESSGVKWRAVEIDGETFFVEASETTVAPKEGLKKKLSEAWNGAVPVSEEASSPVDSRKGAEEAGTWDKAKGFFGSKTEAAAAKAQYVHDIPVLILAGVLAGLSLLAAVASRTSFVWRWTALLAPVLSVAAALTIPATAPAWLAWGSVALAGIAALSMTSALRARIKSFKQAAVPIVTAMVIYIASTLPLLNLPSFAGASLGLVGAGAATCVVALIAGVASFGNIFVLAKRETEAPVAVSGVQDEPVMAGNRRTLSLDDD